MAKPPKLRLRKHDPLQDYYTDGIGWWSVAKLLDDTKHLDVFECPISALNLSGTPWCGSDIIDLAAHCKRVEEADLSKPILLSWTGAIADGRHRVMRALIDGKRTIKARRMTWRPDPCRKESDG